MKYSIKNENVALWNRIRGLFVTLNCPAEEDEEFYRLVLPFNWFALQNNVFFHKTDNNDSVVPVSFNDIKPIITDCFETIKEAFNAQIAITKDCGNSDCAVCKRFKVVKFPLIIKEIKEKILNA